MGTAKMRHAITDGFRGSIESMKSSCGLEPHDVVHMMLVTQYLDVLKEFAQVRFLTLQDQRRLPKIRSRCAKPAYASEADFSQVV
jgi:hypothetical protein